MASAQIQAGIQLVAEACGVDVGVVGQVCIDVGDEEGSSGLGASGCYFFHREATMNQLPQGNH